MKNYLHQSLFLIGILLIVFAPFKKLNAQSEFGAKGGALYSNFKTDYSGMVLDFDLQSGYALGAYFKKENIVKRLGFQAELLYQRKGSIEKFLSGNSNSWDSYGSDSYAYGGYGSGEYFDGTNASWRIHKKHLHYISTPLLLSYSALKYLDVYTGAELGILVGTTGDNIKIEDYNRFSVGMAFGAALKLGENTKLDFRYSTDFTRVAEMGSVNSKNHSFSVTVQQTIFRNK